MLLIYGKWWILLACGGFIGFLLAGIIFDFRWLIVMFMWLCIVLPFSLIFLYIVYGFKEINAINILPHQTNVKENSLEITLFNIEKKSTERNISDEKKKNRKKGGIKYDEGNATDIILKQEKGEKLRTVNIELCKLKRWYPVKNGIILCFRTPPSGFLWIPSDSDTDIHSLIEKLYQLVKRDK